MDVSELLPELLPEPVVEPPPTASGLERALECPASEVLSKIHRTTADATRGNSIHRFVRLGARGVPIADAIQHVAPKWQETCWHIDWQTLLGAITSIRSEHAFSIDVATNEVLFLGEDIGRRYPARARTQFAGTEDIGGIDWDGMPVITDVKTGWQPVTDCADNPQLKFFALRAHLATGADRVRCRIAYIREDGRVQLDPHVFTRIELEDFHDSLRELVDRIEAARVQYAATGTVTVSDGPWCRYCPAVSVCPSKVALAREMLTVLRDFEKGLPVMTDAQMGEAWVKAKECERILEVIIDGLKINAKQRAFLTREGAKQVKSIVYPRADFSTPKALELLHELKATREQIDGCYNIRTVEQVREVNAPKPASAPRKRGRAA